MDCIIDTNVLVDYILLDSELHWKAKEGLEKIDRGLLPSIVIEELVHVLERLKFGKEFICEKTNEVMDSYDIMGVSAENVLEAEKIIMKEEKMSFRKFNDKLILAVAKQAQLPLFTFDKDLKEECKREGVELLP